MVYSPARSGVVSSKERCTLQQGAVYSPNTLLTMVHCQAFRVISLCVLFCRSLFVLLSYFALVIELPVRRNTASNGPFLASSNFVLSMKIQSLMKLLDDTIFSMPSSTVLCSTNQGKSCISKINIFRVHNLE